MNSYMKYQITNMITVLNTFEQSCKLAAMKDDGQIDKTEEKSLKKITAASQRFIRELEKASK